jgi:hypothetical protein
VRFYEREGYGRIPNFGYYAGSAHSLCYAKALQPARLAASRMPPAE